MLRKIRPQSGARRTIFDYGLMVVVAVALAIVVQAFIVKPYLIPSSSMADTLVPGQRVLVDRVVYRFRLVRRGDIIVFRCAPLANTVLIKRVVGLPGDLLARQIRFGCSLQLPAARLPASALEHLQPGDLLRLDLDASALSEWRVGGRALSQAQAMRHGSRRAARIARAFTEADA